MSDVLVTPAFLPTQPDSGDTTKFGPNAWKAPRLFSGGVDGQIVTKSAASATGAAWVDSIPTSRTVNGHALSSDVIVTTGDLGLGNVENTALSTVLASVRAYGAVGDGATDDTSAIQAAIDAVALVGGIVWFPVGTYRCNGQLLLPNDGAAIPTQKPQRWLGAGCHFSGQTMAPTGGSILDLRYAGADAKIKTHGLGSLEIADLTLKDDGTSSNPFLLTTLTTVHVHNVAFVGNPSKANATCDQDAIILGGTSDVGDGTDTSYFQGYGTVIERCYFARIRRGVYGRTAANGLVIRDNTWWNTCGSNSGAAAIEFLGSAVNFCTGNYVVGNLIEMVGYVYGIRASQTVQCYFANSFFDPAVSVVSHYLFEGGANFNLVVDVCRNDTKPLVTESGTAIGTNSWLTPHQSQSSVMTQPWSFKNAVTFSNAVTMAPSPFSPFLIQPGAALANDAVTPFIMRRSAAESSNPGADVASLQQSAKLVLSGSGAGNLEFRDAAATLLASFASNGKQWLLAGAGGNMEINSGTGGSYIRFTAFGLKLRDQASANEIVIKSGAGVPSLAAPVGSLFLRTDGSTGTTLYVKETGGSTSSGWVAK